MLIELLRSIMANCLTRIGCTFLDRLHVVSSCTVDGFCKGEDVEASKMGLGVFDGKNKCVYRQGDITIEEMYSYRLRDSPKQKMYGK
jgi:hypothetical protein